MRQTSISDAPVRLVVIADDAQEWDRAVLVTLAGLSRHHGWQVRRPRHGEWMRAEVERGRRLSGCHRPSASAIIVVAEHAAEPAAHRSPIIDWRLTTVLRKRCLDFGVAGSQACDHLIAHGFTRLAYAGTTAAWSEAIWRGVQRRVPKSVLIAPKALHPVRGENKLRRWLQRAEGGWGIIACSMDRARLLWELITEAGSDAGDLAVIGIGPEAPPLGVVEGEVSCLDLGPAMLMDSLQASVAAALAGRNPPPMQWQWQAPVVRQSSLAQRCTDVVLEQALAHFAANMASGIDCADIARRLHISRRTLERHAQAHWGHGLAQHLRQLRLDRARRLLRETPRSVNAIANAVGFSSGRYLADLFRRTYGQTPSALRNDLRAV